MALAHSRPVTASDIQEYAQVVCSAVLKPARLEPDTTARLIDMIKQGDYFNSLCRILSPLIELEKVVVDEPTRFPDELCDLTDLALFRGDNRALTRRVREALCQFQNNIDAKTRTSSLPVVTKYYSGAYFSIYQSIWLDCLLNEIRARKDPHEKNMLISACLSTASTIVTSIGKQFAQPAKPRSKNGDLKPTVIQSIARDRRMDVPAIFRNWVSRYSCIPHTKFRHKSIRADFSDAIKQESNVKVVYADPPYTRDHYSRFYHVLETMSLGDEPFDPNDPLAGSNRGRYRSVRHQSPFSIRSQAPSAFERMFSLASERGIPIVVSYSPYMAGGHPRMMGILEIIDLGKQHFKSVREVTIEQAVHSKLNRSDLHLEAGAGAEVLLAFLP